MTEDTVIVKSSQNGVQYTNAVYLSTGKSVFAKALLYKVPHKNSDQFDPCLKIGRYKRILGVERVESMDPKSELTLTSDELNTLLEYVERNIRPLQKGEGKYISTKLDLGLAKQLLIVFGDKSLQEIRNFLSQHDELLDSIGPALQFARRSKALEEFKINFEAFSTEFEWQKWFESNEWVLGAGLAEVLDERTIDPDNVADFLVRSPDGFLDVIEIKKPSKNLEFWANSKDHGNIVPHQELVKAITQCQNYLFELEREANSKKFEERVGASIVKPRVTLIYGRSSEWSNMHLRAFRVLNSSYTNLSIMTYDQVLTRANKILDI